MRMFIAPLALAGTLVLAALSAEAQAEEMPRTITVTGTGEVSAPPDMATVVVGVQADAEVAADALDQASAATAAILVRLDQEGVAAEDVRSGAIRLLPQYSQSALSSGRRIVGYRAVNSVEVEVRALEALGGLLSALVGDGANRLDGVRFGLQNPDAALDEARRLAVAEAMRRAALYAGAADVDLGQVLSISEAGGMGYRAMNAGPEMMEMAASSPELDVPVAPGEIDLSASVSMVFEIGTTQ